MGNGEITISFKLHMQHFYLNVTINYWVFVITAIRCGFQSTIRQKYVVSNIYVEDTLLQLLWGGKKK